MNYKSMINFDKEKLEFNKLINQAKKIAITSHIRPDQDAIFSSVAMHRYLKNYKNKDVTIIMEGVTNGWIEMIESSGAIKWVKDLSKEINKYDTWIFLDASEMTRFSNFNISTDLKKLTTICLDHHPQNPDFNYTLIAKSTSMAGTAHLIGEYFIEPNIIEQDQLLGEYVIAGILSDTGNFNFVSKKWATVLSFVQRLIEVYDIQLDTVTRRISIYDKSDITVVTELLKNIIYTQLPNKIPIMYSYLSRQFQDIHNLSLGEIKSGKSFFLVLFLRNIREYEFGFTVTPDSKENGYSLSFRSSPKGINVNEIANNFNGGGHPLAAGGWLSRDLADNTEMAAKYVLNKISQLDITYLDKK